MGNDKTSKSALTLTIDPHQWVARYANYLYCYALKRIKNEDLARELVQETLLAGLERVDKFEFRSSEATWLIAILKNKISDIHRKKAAVFPEMIDISELADTQEPFFNQTDGHWKEKYRPVAFEMNTDDEEEQQLMFMKTLQNCMKKLPSLWLSVFTMKHIDERATRTICQEFAITPANFWVIIHRTKLNLRACLQNNVK